MKETTEQQIKKETESIYTGVTEAEKSMLTGNNKLF